MLLDMKCRHYRALSEIPTKYNGFNARIDSLKVRDTWKSIFMRNHGLTPFVRFFEWVERDRKKRLISFKPESFDLMWAPCLWDEWLDFFVYFFFWG